MFLLAALLSLLLPFQREEYMTWEEFLDFYYSEKSVTSEDAEEDEKSQLQELETLHYSPLNINQATRQDLQRIPFIDEAQIDSLIVYRQRRYGNIHTLGEMQFVSGLSYQDRRVLSLFLYVGEVADSIKQQHEQFAHNHPTTRKTTTGSHQIFTHLFFPLQQRSGDLPHSSQEAHAHPSRYFEGNPLAATILYRYNRNHRLRYGLTLQKDSGEPFGLRGSNTYPFDYNSAHFYYRHESAKGEYEVAAGDYRLRIGQGLVVGGMATASRTGLLMGLPMATVRMAPHTGCDEWRFLRGGAYSHTFPLHSCYSLQVMGFLSYRGLDGSMSVLNENNEESYSIKSIHTSGLHRTLTELRERNTVHQLFSGAHVAIVNRMWLIGLGGAWAHYSHPLAPTLQYYNIHRLRGQDAAAFAADYSARLGTWHFQGELACDKDGHLATSHILRKRYHQHAWFVQARAISAKYIGPYSYTLTQASSQHVQNELALLAGASLLLKPKWKIDAYAEIYHFPQPVYRCNNKSTGVEASAQSTYDISDVYSVSLRYRLKSRDYNVTGYANVQEHIGISRIRLQWNAHWYAGALSIMADGSLYATQTERMKKGLMLSARGSWKALQSSRPLTLSGYIAAFTTESYDARLYAFVPHLSMLSGRTALSYKGMAGNLLAEWTPIKWGSVGLQYNCLHYFNRDHVGSGVTTIDSPTRHELHMVLKLKF